ncbi:MAG: hypothetical protein ACR2PP_02135 [Psychrobacter sp.]
MTDRDLLRRLFTADREDFFCADEVQRLNTLLSNMSISDIPEESIRDTESYLISVLTMNAVAPALRDQLEKLLADIQER